MRKKIDFPANLILVFLLTVSSLTVFSEDFKVIKNPKPNMKEKHYVLLKEAKTIDADLGNGEYLFKPFSITADKKSVFVYDILQARIFKLDPNLEMVKKSFGQRGAGPGEIGGTGKTYPVFIKMGRDGKLYVNDLRMRKIIIFDQNGKYLGEFKNMITNTNTPLVDAAGNLHIISVKDKVINLFNVKKSPLFTIADQKNNFNYLFSTPGPEYLGMASKNLAGELLTALTIDSTLLIYFPSSSTMLMLKEKKIKRMNIWPQEALACYKNDLEELLEKEKGRYKFIFHTLIPDEENAGVFFLQFEKNKKRGINALYQFNLIGNLLKVFYIKLKESEPFTRFEVVKGDMFYAIEGDKLKIYKEVIE